MYYCGSFQVPTLHVPLHVLTTFHSTDAHFWYMISKPRATVKQSGPLGSDWIIGSVEASVKSIRSPDESCWRITLEPGDCEKWLT